MAPTAASSVMEGRGLRSASPPGLGGASGAGLLASPTTLPSRLPRGSGIGSWGGLRRTLIRGQITGCGEGGSAGQWPPIPESSV